MNLIKCGTLEMLVPKKSREDFKTLPKQNIIDALLEKYREAPETTIKELELFAEGYKRGKINRHERTYRVD